jgi:hypothetical protein
VVNEKPLNSKHHMIYISSNNVRRPATKTFTTLTTLHPTTLHFSSLHYTKLHFLLFSDWDLHHAYTVHAPYAILVKVTVPLALELTATQTSKQTRAFATPNLH